MIRKTATALSILSAALIASACTVQVGSKTPDSPPPAPAPAPDPAAAATTPAVAAAPAAPKVTPKPAEPSHPDTAAAPVGKVEQKGGAIQLPGSIVFDFDKATLTPNSGSDVVLGQLKDFLVENDKKISVLRIEGYTDNQGDAAHNLELSGQRALTIKKWLTANGISADRLIAVGFGADKPVAPNNTAEGQAQNRRTEFKIAGAFDKAGKVTGYLQKKVDRTAGGKEFN